MFKATLIEMVERELLKLREEINLYPDEQTIWAVRGNIANSAGNLCLHLLGNLNHFVGTILGKTGYIRDRDAEFSLKNVPRNELINSIDETIPMLKNVLGKLSAEDLAGNYPAEKHGQIVTMTYMLLHLITHLNYHLGQVNYHRRLVVQPVISSAGII